MRIFCNSIRFPIVYWLQVAGTRKLRMGITYFLPFYSLFYFLLVAGCWDQKTTDGDCVFPSIPFAFSILYWLQVAGTIKLRMGIAYFLPFPSLLFIYSLLVAGGLLWRSGGAGASVRGTELGAASRRVGGEGGPGQDQGAHPSPLLTRYQALQGAAGRPKELPPAGLPLGRV